MPYKVTLPPGEPALKPLGVSPIPEKGVPAVPTGSSGHPPDPKARLWSLLNTWASIDEAAWTQEAVDGLKDSILDVFHAHPEAGVWFAEWRQAHPEARLC